jgi:hypothetical protein
MATAALDNDGNEIHFKFEVGAKNPERFVIQKSRATGKLLQQNSYRKKVDFHT